MQKGETPKPVQVFQNEEVPEVDKDGQAEGDVHVPSINKPMQTKKVTFAEDPEVIQQKSQRKAS